MYNQDSQIKVLTYFNTSRYAAVLGLKQARRPFATYGLECCRSLLIWFLDTTQSSLEMQPFLRKMDWTYVQACTSNHYLPATTIQIKSEAKGGMTSILIMTRSIHHIMQHSIPVRRAT